MKSAVVFIFSTIAVVVVLCPLQLYISLSRPQHYGLAVGALGIGYILQSALSWRVFGKFERACYLATGAFFSTMASVLIQNSWLDATNSVQTEDQLELRKVILAAYLFFGLAMAGMWLALIIRNMKAQERKKSKNQG